MLGNKWSALMAGTVLAGAVSAGGVAQADDNLSWSYASAQVSNCVVGVTCGQPGGLNVLARESFVGTNVDYNNASVYLDDYNPGATLGNYGQAWASAEAGDGLLALPVLKAYALGGATGSGPNPTIAVNVASVQAIQGFTNTSANAVIIPLNAFTGVVDYQMFGPPTNPGTIYAGLAITTSAILDPTVSSQWFGTATGGSGGFTATCGTQGALALGAPAAATSFPTGGTQYLPVTTSSCTGEDTFTLDPGESFYIWSRLAVVRSAFGVTDASHTFNVTITPEAKPFVQANLASFVRTDGANLTIPISPVPEPSTWAMMIVGLGGLGAMLRRRRLVAA